MVYGNNWLGKQIISLDQGRKLGSVKDLYFNEELTKLTGLHLGTEGLISRTAQVIERGEIVLFGVDSILVKRSDVVKEGKTVDGFKSWVRRDKVIGREMETPGGTRVAAIGDVILEDDDRVAGFSLGRTYVESPVAESGAVSREVMIEAGHDDSTMTIDLKKAELEEFQSPKNK